MNILYSNRSMYALLLHNLTINLKNLNYLYLAILLPSWGNYLFLIVIKTKLCFDPLLFKI
jgi:hypothetical protein